MDLNVLLPRGGKLVPIKIEVWDSDDLKNNRTHNDDLLGRTSLSWSQIWPGEDSDFTLPLTGSKAKGTVEISVHLTPVEGATEAFDGTPNNAAAEVAAAGRSLFNHANDLTSAGGAGGAGGGGSASSPYPGTAPTVISKGACTAVLAKSYGFKIADTCDTVHGRCRARLSQSSSHPSIRSSLAHPSRPNPRQPASRHPSLTTISHPTPPHPHRRPVHCGPCLGRY